MGRFLPYQGYIYARSCADLKVLNCIGTKVVVRIYLKRCMKKANPIKWGVYGEVEGHWVCVWGETTYIHKLLECDVLTYGTNHSVTRQTLWQWLWMLTLLWECHHLSHKKNLWQWFGVHGCAKLKQEWRTTLYLTLSAVIEGYQWVSWLSDVWVGKVIAKCNGLPTSWKQTC